MTDLSAELAKLGPVPEFDMNEKEDDPRLVAIVNLHEARQVHEWVGPKDDDFGIFDICAECMAPWPCATYRLAEEVK